MAKSFGMDLLDCFGQLRPSDLVARLRGTDIDFNLSVLKPVQQAVLEYLL